MGMFSYQCSECDHPALSIFATNDVNVWMNDVVAVMRDGSVVRGDYDGYGRLDLGDGEEFDLLDREGDFELYHYACWVKAGKPGFKREARHAPDQGYFFEDGAHDMAHPLGQASSNG